MNILKVVATYVYDDFRVTFTSRADGAFDVRACDQEGAVATSVFSVPLSETDLERAVLQFARGHGASRKATPSKPTTRDVGGDGPPTMNAEQLGGALADALFQGDVAAAYNHARAHADDRERGLRLSLSLANTPALLSVPWEFLYRAPRFLASQRRTPLVRLLDAGSLAPPPEIHQQVRILGVVASPTDLAPLDVAQERRRVEQALAVVCESGRVVLDWLEPATPRTLRQNLRDGNYHVLHYVGHSDFTEQGTGVLFLEHSEDRRSVPVDDTLFANLLADQRMLRLVVLNSCEGARTTLTDPYAGVATTLVQLGVPAVVAMQFEISDEAAIVFAEELYTNLISRQDPIDASVAEARKAIYSEVDSVEWATPVLFVRDPEVELFRFEVPADPDAVPTAPPGAPPAEPSSAASDGAGAGGGQQIAATTSDETEPVPAAGGWTKRRRLLAGVAAGVLVLSIVLGIVVWNRDDGENVLSAPTTTAAATTPTAATTTTTVLDDDAPLPPTAPWPDVGTGASGPAVTAAQYLLRHRDFRSDPSGFFDNLTLRAVKEFETSLQLPADGLVGRLTWSELVVSVKAGHEGDAVRAAQTLLNVSGHAMDIDGLYGPATQDSVVEFQRSHRLNVDGIVDADTWRLLLAEASR